MKKNTVILIILILALNILSLVSLYSALHKGGEFLDKSTFVKQIIWILLGWSLAIILSFINYRMFYDFALWFYFVSLVLLILVAVLGKMQMGAQRWIAILGINFQPAELAKIAALFMICRSFSRDRRPYPSLIKGFWQEIIQPFLPLTVLFILIFIQPDLGTSLIIIFLYMMMLLGCGVRKKYILFLCLLMLIIIPLGFSLLKDYQKDRLLVFINPNSDPLGAGYTIIQSKIAIGSGGILGKGFLAGTQNQLNFIPARHTDFIFTVFAEEWGFFGCMVLLALYFTLLKFILDVASSVKDRYSYVLCIGIFSIFFIHIFINLSMVMGLLPVVGLPLLFFSYGGSYILSSFILIGILLNITQNE